MRKEPRSIELLSPAKDLICGREAINHGADAVYIGAPKFGARAAAGNDGDLAGFLVGGAVAAQIALGILHLIAMGRIDALEHIVHIGLRRIDDLFHRIASLLVLFQVSIFLENRAVPPGLVHF